MRIVRQLSDAHAAVQAGAGEMMTPENSGCVAGVGYWEAVQRLLRQEFPDSVFTLWVCCGRNGAVAHDALRMGLDIRFLGSPAMHAKLQSVAQGLGRKMLDNVAA